MHHWRRQCGYKGKHHIILKAAIQFSQLILGLAASRMFLTVMSWLETLLRSFAKLSAVVDQIPGLVCKVRETVLYTIMKNSILKSNIIIGLLNCVVNV